VARPPIRLKGGTEDDAESTEALDRLDRKPVKLLDRAAPVGVRQEGLEARQILRNDVVGSPPA